MKKFFDTPAFKRVIVPVLFCAAVLPARAAEPVVPTSAQAQAGLTRELTELARLADDAYNRRDAQAMSELYAPDATTTIGSLPLAGRAAILEYFTKSFRNLPAGMVHRTVLRRVEPVGDMYATDNAVYLEMPDGAQGKRVVREFFTFGLVRRTANGWEFVAVRATPLGPAQMAAPAKQS